MKFEHDPLKDRSNQTKHGVSLDLAQKLEWDEALVWIDQRFGVDEWRMRALVPAGQVLFHVAFVDRADTRRVISLRRATRREVKHYVENC
jgi:hypothetical protein